MTIEKGEWEKESMMLRYGGGQVVCESKAL